MKRSQPKRDWSDARAKVEAENGCRLCGSWPVEAAHTTGRKYDKPRPGAKPGTLTLHVHPDSVVPLCKGDHYLYDTGQLDLLPHLTLDEQLRAVADAGGIEQARVRLAPSCYGREAA